MNKSSKFSTLKEVIEALKRIDKYAALYLWSNFDEEDFQHGYKYCAGALREHSLGPLDFFDWGGKFNWGSLNYQLKMSKVANKTNLNDYIIKDIDLTGCNPVIAEALKQNKSILCKVRDEGSHLTEQYNIVFYTAGKPYPYVTTNHSIYKHAEPIKKTKTELTELRVKDPVSIMQYLTDNNWSINKLGQFVKKNNYKSFDFRDISFCGQVPPEDWQWPELLEEVAVIYEPDTDAMDDPFEY